MKIAIMGAGLSGLSCAVLLEKNGIIPDIYEAQYKIAARFSNTETIMNVLDYPVKDEFKYIEKKYGVKLKPLNNLKKVIVHGPSEKAAIEGELGFITVRGNHPDALEVQLGDISKAPVITNSYYTLDDLKEKYDYIVYAAGNNQEPRRQEIWETDVVTNLIGANITGSFDPNTSEIWFNDEFAPQGNGFLLPYNSGTASLAIGVPGTEGVKLENLWKKFLKALNRDYTIKDTFVLHSFEIGRNKALVKDNVIYTGNAGGFLMPFLGFGQFTSMVSGFEAANAIIKQDLKLYIKAVEPLKKSYQDSLKMRRIFSKMDNKQYDLLVKLFKSKFTSMVFSKFPLPALKTAAAALFPFTKP